GIVADTARGRTFFGEQIKRLKQPIEARPYRPRIPPKTKRRNGLCLLLPPLMREHRVNKSQQQMSIRRIARLTAALRPYRQQTCINRLVLWPRKARFAHVDSC